MGQFDLGVPINRFYTDSFRAIHGKLFSQLAQQVELTAKKYGERLRKISRHARKDF